MWAPCENLKLLDHRPTYRREIRRFIPVYRVVCINLAGAADVRVVRRSVQAVINSTDNFIEYYVAVNVIATL